MVINIVSINVRGIREVTKRTAIFDFYRNKCDVLCLQETHCSEPDEQIWKSEWGGQIVFSNGTSAARGVAICCKKPIITKDVL